MVKKKAASCFSCHINSQVQRVRWLCCSSYSWDRRHFHSSLDYFLLANPLSSLPASHVVSRCIDHNRRWAGQLFSHFAAVIDLFKSSQNGLVCRLSPEFCGNVVQIGERDAFLVPLHFLCSIFPIAQRAGSLKYFQTAVWQHLNM